MALMTLTLDMSDVMAVTDYISDAIKGWSEERAEGLHRDIGALLDSGALSNAARRSWMCSLRMG